MTSFRKLAALIIVLGGILSGCTVPMTESAATPDDQKILALAAGLQQLGPEVDPVEAMRAAEVAVRYSRQLEIEYEVEDSPLVHNSKVNMGLKPRGLCYQWADDLEVRLAQEGFQTLRLHRAVANAFEAFRIEHSTVIVSRAGDGMNDGIVLDPWRYGGTLHWSKTLEDEHYVWIPRAEVWRIRREEKAREARAQ